MKRHILGVLIGLVALATASCRSNNPTTFTQAIAGADKAVVHEGLPHHMDRDRLAEERRNKEVREIHGYPFYEDTLVLTEEDSRRLTGILSKSAAYRPFSGEKKCGGFHPDYAVEYQVGGQSYWALICFGCHEVKLHGPSLETRNDVDEEAFNDLLKVLRGYRKNRPPYKLQFE